MKTQEEKMNKQYADRDIENQGKPYATHICAMTSEQLLSKSDIAAELAHRDIEIEALKAEVKQQDNLLNQSINASNRLQKEVDKRGDFINTIEAERDRLREYLKTVEFHIVESVGVADSTAIVLVDLITEALNHKEG